MNTAIKQEISHGRRHAPFVSDYFERPKPKLFEIEGARVVRYPNFYHFEDPLTTLGDILLIPGFPGLQSMQVLAETLQDYGFSVYIPVYPGIGQSYSRLQVLPQGQFSFTEAQKQVETIFKAVKDNSCSRLILGGYSIGAVLATNLIEKFPNSIDRTLIIGGTFHSKRIFHETKRGIESFEKYIRACCAMGKVPLRGDPDFILRDWLYFLEKSPNPEDVLSKQTRPVAILHSPTDKEFPLSYVSKYFPKNAKFFPLDVTHMMHYGTDRGHDAGNDIAAMFYRFLKGDYDVREGFRRRTRFNRNHEKNPFNQNEREYFSPMIWTWGPGPYDPEFIPTRRMRYVDAGNFKRTF